MMLIYAATKGLSITMPPAVTFVTVILAVISATAFIIAYSKKEIAKNTIEIQSEQIDALESRRVTLMDENQKLQLEKLSDFETYQKKIAQLTQDLSELEASVRTLESMKSGAEAVDLLRKQIYEDVQTNRKILNDILDKMVASWG